MKSRRHFASLMFLAVSLVLATSSLLAQNSGPKYDFNNEVKLKGTVDEIKMVPGEFEGVHVMLKTATETILVHIAPEGFLKMLDFTVNKGDALEVTGCKITGEFGPEILAREVVAGNNSLTLRDKKGLPAWAGMKFAGN
ncbi:MAG TPA: hypothetical protein VGL89_18225 [Candidatus Koribacter sp.]|jgi:hypothetical protein